MGKPRGTISTRAMRKQCLVRPAAAIFRDALRFWFAYTQKRVWLSSTRKSPLRGWGRGKVFLHRGPQERSIPDMVQCLLDNLNG
jgi:hypothetical protein